MSLGKRLKTIYTSGDTYTVLELIKKLIDEVENYEEEQNSKRLYRHEIVYETPSGNKQLTIVNTSRVALLDTSDMKDLYGTSSETVFNIVSDNVVAL